MDLWKAVQSVLAVIAIMLVAGGIVYLLSGVVVNALDKKNKAAQPKEAKPVERREETLLLENSREFEEQPLLEEAQEVEGETIDLALADEEQRAIENQRNELAARQKVVAEANDYEEEPVAEDEDINDIYQRMIAEINAEAMQEDSEEDETITDDELDEFIGEIDEEDEDNIDLPEDLFVEEEIAEEPAEETEEVAEEEVQEEPAEEITEEPVEEITEEEVEEVVEEVEKVEAAPEEEVVDTEKEDLKKLVEELKLQLAKEQAEKADLEKVAQTRETEVVDSESIESLTARLEVLTERLAQSEKELKVNKKEYMPLLRIKKTLENDKAKLRRKEAVVAKQKVVLFGVNNYVVDPEKEKKLNEDLDLLDALRLSVQHCEEVIKDNEDRYPILEKTNAILTRQIEDLKADIADINARIEAKKGNEDNN